MHAIPKTIFRIFVLRVSGKGDHEGSANQLEMLRGYEHVPGVRWLLDNFDIRIMRASSASGRRLREDWSRRYGLEPLRRQGRDDFLGVSLVLEGTRFVIYASTAAQLDEESGNAFTRHLIRFIKETAFTGHADDDFTRRRDAGELDGDEHPSICNAFDATRFVRSLARASELWEAAKWARAAFDVKDVRVDPEGGEAQAMLWNFLAFGSEMETEVGKIRRFVGRLNLARAGYYPYRQASAPLGFTTTKGKTRSLIVDEHQVTAVAVLHRLGMGPADAEQIAGVLGAEHDVRSGDPKTLGKPIHELEHPGLAARRLYLRRKLLAYRDGEFELEFVGVLPNRLRPGSGHILRRRWLGLNAEGRHDEYGSVSYKIPAPKPNVPDHTGAPRPGWLAGLSAEGEYQAWTALIDRRGWDDGAAVQPGHSTDPANANPLLSSPAARSGPRRLTEPVMALSRLCLYRDEEGGPRTKLFPRAAGGRYELRRERHTSTSEGIRYKRTELIASWPDHELRGHLAAMLRSVAHALLDEGVELGPLPGATAQGQAPAAHDTQHEVERLRDEAAEQRTLAEGFELAEAAELASPDPDPERLESLRARARDARSVARARERGADALAAPTTERVDIDFGQLRDVIAALEGAYASGLVPPALNRVLREILPGGLRFAPGPDSISMRMTATVELPLATGGTASAPGELLVPHAAGRGQTAAGERRIADLAAMYMRDGRPIDEVARAGRVTNTDHMVRMIREALTSGSRRVAGQLDHDGMRRRMPDPRRRAAAFTCPIPELRSVVWHRLTGTPGRPAGTSQAYNDLINDLYFAEPPVDLTGRSISGYSRPWAWEANTDRRLEQHAILLALPGPAKQMRADHLGAALGTASRHATGLRLVLDSSTDLTRNGHLYARTLRRLPAAGHPEGWYGRQALPPSAKLVGLPECPHSDCNERYATAIVLAPEVLRFGTAVICRRCKRPAADTAAARRTVFPDSVITWADHQPRRTGAWVACGLPGCRKDIGAGQGLAWRWDDMTGPAWHDDDCRTGSAAPSRYARCRYADCAQDESGGPGSIEIVRGSGTRRWHSRACGNAEARRLRKFAKQSRSAGLAAGRSRQPFASCSEQPTASTPKSQPC